MRVRLILAGCFWLTLFMAAAQARAEAPTTQPATELSAATGELRDKLLADADRRLRAGIVELAETYPFLRDSRGWDRLRDGESGPGHIGVHFVSGTPSKAGDGSVPPGERFGVLVVIREPSPQIAQLVMLDVYPHLGLVGQVASSAGDERLGAALAALVREALAPLAKLNDAVGRGEAPSTQPSGE